MKPIANPLFINKGGIMGVFFSTGERLSYFFSSATRLPRGQLWAIIKETRNEVVSWNPTHRLVGFDPIIF